MRQKDRNLFYKYAIFLLLIVSCSFDYGQGAGSESGEPDIVMENVEYVRVRSAEPQVRFFAEHAEKYENKKLMELRNFSFEQFGRSGDKINAAGRAGSASIQIDTGNISLSDNVRVEVESEDIVIETFQLRWDDETHMLTAGEDEEVQIYKGDGTYFIGVGFQADARKRTWDFLRGVSGSYVYNDEESKESGTR